MVKDISPEVQKILMMGLDLNGQGEFNLAREQFQKALDISKSTKDIQGEVNALHQLARLAFNVDVDFSVAKNLLNQCLKIYSGIHNDSGKAQALDDLGTVSQLEGNWDSALEWFEEALEIYERLNHKEGKATCLYQLGIVAKNTNNIFLTEKYWRESLLIFNTLSDKYGAGRVLLSQGNLEIERQGDLVKAKNIIAHAIVLLEDAGDSDYADRAKRLIEHLGTT